VHPVAFKLGDLAIHWYGVLMAVGFLLGLWTATRRSPRDGLAPGAIADLAPWLLVGGLLGARLLYVVTFWKEEFAGQPNWQIFMIRTGLVFYGGLIGATLACLLFLWRRKLPAWKVGDTLAPSIALGHVFGRLGCFFTGCCHGAACDLPWAIRFPAEHATGGRPVHPTQLYEAVLNLLLYVALERLYRKKRFDGQVFALYLMAYGVLRAFVDLFRGDYGELRVLGLTPGQAVSGFVLVVGLVLYRVLSKAGPKPA
jgi:phosphatidylglycerol:prolipoprotein diacylglycerol transferase